MEDIKNSLLTINNRKPIQKVVKRNRIYTKKDGTIKQKEYEQTITIDNKAKNYDYKHLKNNLLKYIKSLSNDDLVNVSNKLIHLD